MANSGGGPASGIRGASGGLPLVDVLQVWSMNRFSGLVNVTADGETGHVYFVDGEVVHAEAEGAEGEEALQFVLGWQNSAFEPFPNTTTLKRTIQKRLSHLLLDAHRVLDERRRNPSAPPRTRATSAAPAAREPTGVGPMDQVRAIGGVTRLVRFGADGRPLGEGGQEEEALAARGLYLAMMHAGAAAAAFGLRELSWATLQGDPESLVVVHSQGNYLCVAVSPGVAVDQVATQVVGLLSRPAGRKP